jgi:two-component system chemotaxis response regulator CheB
LIYIRRSNIRLVTMASSTGGPGVLAGILSRLPSNFPVPILIVQHITPGFGEELAIWLNQQTPLQVRLARHADEPQPGQVLLAPDNAHMRVNGLGLIALSHHALPHDICPSANYLFHSVTEVYGPRAVGVILTGMGSDGAEGLQALRQAGGHTIAQDRASSIVFGMPAVAIELGAAEQILPANRIASALLALLGL